MKKNQNSFDMNKQHKVLVIVAHPDDEVLGCGGAIARLAKESHDVYIAILGEGITSRYKNLEHTNRGQIRALQNASHLAAKVLGAKNTFFQNLPDNRFDTVPLLDIVKKIEKIKKDIKPDIIFTHYKNDLNIDHKITYNAVITATRPVESETVKEIYSFEVLSSTEWNYPLSFSPNVFFDITDTLRLKLKAANEYKIELRNFPHPRSLEGIKLNAKYWGIKSGLGYAEVFESVRVIK